VETEVRTGDEAQGMPVVPEPMQPSGGGNFLIRNLRFIIRNHMYSWNYWRSVYRFIKFKLLHHGIKTEGFVFLPRHYEISKGKKAEFTIGALSLSERAARSGRTRASCASATSAPSAARTPSTATTTSRSETRTCGPTTSTWWTSITGSSTR